MKTQGGTDLYQGLNFACILHTDTLNSSLKVIFSVCFSWAFDNGQNSQAMKA